MPVSISPSDYNIELLGLTCNIGYKGRIRPLPPIIMVEVARRHVQKVATSLAGSNPAPDLLTSYQ